MLHILCALPCEGRPIIRRLGLEPREASGDFRVYTAKNIALVISGYGKTPAAAAVGYLMGDSDSSSPAWLNVGIAGHATRAIGDVVLVHKITDDATGNNFYPPLIFEAPCPTENLLTVDLPVGRDRPYPGDTACDMEGSAFIAAACRFSPLELIHGLKVISDNAEANVDHLTEELAEGLIEQHVDLVEEIANTLLALQKDHATRVEPHLQLDTFLEKWRFTTTQARQLEGHLRRWVTLSGQPEVVWNDYEDLSNARSVLAQLEKTIHALPLRL